MVRFRLGVMIATSVAKSMNSSDFISREKPNKKVRILWIFYFILNEFYK